MSTQAAVSGATMDDEENKEEEPVFFPGTNPPFDIYDMFSWFGLVDSSD